MQGVCQSDWGVWEGFGGKKYDISYLELRHVILFLKSMIYHSFRKVRYLLLRLSDSLWISPALGIRKSQGGKHLVNHGRH